MSCTKCGATKDTSKVVEEKKIPFKCPECGGIDFPIKAMNGIVFVWQEKQPAKIGSIIIPERLNQPFTSHFAVVLSHGKGCKDVKTGKFVHCELEVGDKIWRDKDTPWKMPVEAPDGLEYEVCYMNILDIWVKEGDE